MIYWDGKLQTTVMLPEVPKIGSSLMLEFGDDTDFRVFRVIDVTITAAHMEPTTFDSHPDLPPFANFIKVAVIPVGEAIDADDEVKLPPPPDYARGLEDYKPFKEIHGNGWMSVFEGSTMECLGVIRPGFVPSVGSNLTLMDEAFKPTGGRYRVVQVSINATVRKPEDQLTALAVAEAEGKPVPTLPATASIIVERITSG